MSPYRTALRAPGTKRLWKLRISPSIFRPSYDDPRTFTSFWRAWLAAKWHVFFHPHASVALLFKYAPDDDPG